MAVSKINSGTDWFILHYKRDEVVLHAQKAGASESLLKIVTGQSIVSKSHYFIGTRYLPCIKIFQRSLKFLPTRGH